MFCLSFFFLRATNNSDFLRDLVGGTEAVFSDKTLNKITFYSSFFVSLFKLEGKCEIFLLLRTNRSMAIPCDAIMFLTEENVFLWDFGALY